MAFARAGIACMLVVLTITNVSAAAVNDVVRGNTKTVSRAQFIEWSMRLFGSTGSTCDIQGRVPLRSRRYICEARELGLLPTFDNPDDFTQPITRGDIALFLMKLTGKNGSADTSKLRDIKPGSDLDKAVQTMLGLKWMTPLRSTSFGKNATIGTTEVRALLQAVTGSAPAKTTTKFTIERANVLPPDVPKGDLLQFVWQLIERDYLRLDTLKRDEIGYALIDTLLKTLNDPYSTFFRPVQADNFQTQIKGEVSGIGAHVESQSGAILIVAPIPGSPAEKADLRSGDQILSVDGVSVTGLPLDEAVNRIRGEKGSSVKLTIRRGNREFDVIIVRDTVTVPEIDLQWQDTTAVIRLAQFGELTNEKIREVFKQVNERHPQGIILDLRNNPGGLLQAADELMSAFMPKGTVVAIVRGRNGESKELTSEEPVVDKDIKMAVLVNAGSASASEIVAGALQDYKRATIIGTQSFGKGTVQELVNFQGGEALKLTIAEWSTPLDRTINGVGVAPDIVVEPDDTDSQLRRALQILR